MDNPFEVIKIIGYTLLAVVVFNLLVIRRFTRKNNNELQYWTKVLDRAKNPFKNEDQDLDQLAKLVEQSKNEEGKGRNSEEKPEK
ncbi:MAG: hypothetical protein ABFS17_05605 [Chloroflexota bacterium]